MAEQGAAQAMFNLGSMYENGLDVTKDPDEAARLYIQAAAKNHKGSQEKIDEIHAREAARRSEILEECLDSLLSECEEHTC